MGFIGVMVVYCLFPIYWLVISAAKSTQELLSTNGFVPGAGFDLVGNLSHVFSYQGSAFAYWIGDTLLYAGVGAALATVLAAAAGYAFAKYRFRGRGVTFMIIIAGVMVPLPALSVPLYLVASRVGLLDTVWSVFIPSCVAPLGVYLARIYAARAVPNELIDAGRIDGAREGTIFWRVGMPLMMPALATIFLFSFVGIWNNFFLPLVMLSNVKLFPLSLGLYTWMSDTMSPGSPSFLYGTVVTGSFVSIVPLAVAFLLLQRYWTTGLSLGAVNE